ncbi:LuxR C-terminal-related transcriptional regulator [Streptomyces misionensis]|uniref:LuxR C-terminal-related transcriptional regulator n=1 Tax=Streptomyces misionensis TaxID=67331 RepID=UPI0037D993BB
MGGGVGGGGGHGGARAGPGGEQGGGLGAAQALAGVEVHEHHGDVARAAAGDIDVVLMDLQFGKGMGGAQATALITARPGAPRVVVVTTYDSDADTLPAIEAGATGYLLKDAPPEDLAAAVRTAAAGRTTLAPAVAERLMNRLRAPGTALTRRETEVLALVADGLSNQAVGRRLHLTEGTVKSHLARVYTKLGVDSRTAAVAAATDLGLIRR